MKFITVLLTILMGTLVSISSFAQEEEVSETTTQAEDVTPQETEETTASPAPNNKGVEKLEVTGSHIKRIDIEGPSPVLTLDKDYLDRTGYNNVGDVLRDTTVASFGGIREAALTGGAGTGASTTSLRGFDSDRILVLMDGKRLPTIGGSSSVDLALIPMAAVQRIEILKDGASAIYGSDALGGVINVITKKEYDGGSVDLGYTQPESAGGRRTDVKASYGKTFSKGDILGSIQYRKNSATQSRDYDYARPTPDWFSASGSPGTWVDSGGSNAGGGADPCPAERDLGGVCVFDYSPYSQITPEIDQYSALLAGNYKINEELKVYGRGIYTHRDVKSQLAPAPDSFRDATSTGGLNTQIDQATAIAWGLPAGSDLSLVRYRLVEEGGPRKSSTVSDSYALQTGVTGFLSDTWEWEGSATYGASDTDSKGVAGFANKQMLFDMANETPSAFNPFAAPGSKNDISAAFYTPLDTIFSSITTIDFRVSGEVLEMPAGPLALAVGVANAWQTYEQTTDAISGSGGQWGGSTPSSGEGLRDFQSAYAEFSVPAMTGLEFQLAGRFDNYSDFGSTVNPKVGFRYRPMDAVMIRGSWGTGYRAPALEDLYQQQTTSYEFGIDPQTGDSTQFETLIGGNPNLKQETTNSFNFGSVIQILKSLSFEVDYWKTTQENVVSQAEMRNIFAAEKQFGNAFLNGFGIDVIRNGTTGKVDRIVNPSVNLASLTVSGLDFRLMYDTVAFSDFRFRFGVDHSLLFSYLNEPFPGLGEQEQVGFAGIPYWRNNVTIGLGNQTYDFSAMVRTIGETNASELSETPGDFGKTRDHTELDLRAQYNTSWKGSFSVMVKNTFNTKRPYYLEYLTNGYLDTALYDPFGRAVGVTYSQEF